MKQNLVIFENAEITKIEKTGFERGVGFLLTISLVNDKKEYKINAGYIPRFKKLNVLRLEEIKTQEKKPIEIGKELIGKIVNDVPKQVQTTAQNVNLQL